MMTPTASKYPRKNRSGRIPSSQSVLHEGHHTIHSANTYSVPGHSAAMVFDRSSYARRVCLRVKRERRGASTTATRLEDKGSKAQGARSPLRNLFPGSYSLGVNEHVLAVVALNVD